MDIITVTAVCASIPSDEYAWWTFTAVKKHGDVVVQRIPESVIQPEVPSMDAEEVALWFILCTWPEFESRVHGTKLTYMREPNSSTYSYVVEIDVED